MWRNWSLDLPLYVIIFLCTYMLKRKVRECRSLHKRLFWIRVDICCEWNRIGVLCNPRRFTFVALLYIERLQSRTLPTTAQFLAFSRPRNSYQSSCNSSGRDTALFSWILVGVGILNSVNFMIKKCIQI